MKSYEQAIEQCAKSYVHFCLYPFNSEHRFDNLNGMAYALSVAYEKDEDIVRIAIRNEKRKLADTMDEWYEEFCKSIEEE